MFSSCPFHIFFFQYANQYFLMTAKNAELFFWLLKAHFSAFQGSLVLIASSWKVGNGEQHNIIKTSIRFHIFDNYSFPFILFFGKQIV